jgi:GAF domain-containing protein
MTEPSSRRAPPRVIVVADVKDTSQGLIARVLTPAGIQGWSEEDQAPPHDLLVVDITQLRGDPLAKLRARREAGDQAPAIVLAAHFPPARLRDLFRLSVSDVLNKPYKPEDLTRAVFELAETRAAETNTQILANRVESMREQLRRRTEEIRQLSEIGRTVASLEDLDTILTRVVEAAAFVTDAEEANIYLAEPGTDELVLRASKNPESRQASLQRLRVTDTLVGEVFRTGQALLHQPSLEGGPVKVQTGFMVQSLVEVPLRAGPKIVGVLAVHNRLSDRRFTEHHQIVLQALADWAGVALEHAALTLQSRSPTPAPNGGKIEGAPVSLVQGLKRTQEHLNDILAAGTFTESEQAALRSLQSELTALSNVRLAVVDSRAAGAMLDLQVLVAEIAQEAGPVAERRTLKIEFRGDPSTPLLDSDPARIRKALEALIASSMRRSDRGTILIQTHHFEVSNGQAQAGALPFGVSLPDGLWASVSVTDSGSPLDPEVVRALTSPENDPSGGPLGRGLSMGEIRMMVESLDGKIWFEQSPGGVRIAFAIPVA